MFWISSTNSHHQEYYESWVTYTWYLPRFHPGATRVSTGSLRHLQQKFGSTFPTKYVCGRNLRVFPLLLFCNFFDPETRVSFALFLHNMFFVVAQPMVGWCFMVKPITQSSPPTIESLEIGIRWTLGIAMNLPIQKNCCNIILLVVLKRSCLFFLTLCKPIRWCFSPGRMGDFSQT